MEIITPSTTIRMVVLEQIERIAEQQRKPLAPLTEDLHLLNSGLDSLCLAVLVASLDDRLGVDPFDGDGNVQFPVTLGEFIRIYENAAT